MNHNIKRDELNLYLEAGSTEAVLAAVESGMGVSIISRWAIMKMDSARRIRSVNLVEQDAKRFFYILYPRQKSRRKTVNNFLEHIKKTQDLEKA